jgi:hypothetical protein
MDYPYPRDRSSDPRTKGEEPYKDAKLAFTQKEAKLQAKAEEYGEEQRAEESDEPRTPLEARAIDRLDEIGQEVAREAGYGDERGT